MLLGSILSSLGTNTFLNARLFPTLLDTVLVPQIADLSVLSEIDETVISIARLLMRAESMRTVYAHLWTKVMQTVIGVAMKPAVENKSEETIGYGMDVDFDAEEGYQPSFSRLFTVATKVIGTIDVGSDLAREVCAGVADSPGVYDAGLKSLASLHISYLQTAVAKAGLVLRVQ